MTTRRLSLAVALCVLLLPACDDVDLVAHRLPACDPTGDPTTHLMSQSVPGATLLPCLHRDELPSTWWLSDLEVDSREAEFALTADRVRTGPGLVVRLVASCDDTEAVRVPTDEPGTEKLVGAGGPGGFATEWQYRFAGGCVTYRVVPPVEYWDRFVVDVQRAVGFIDRDEVVRRHDEALGR